MSFIKFTSGPARFDALKGGGIDLGWGALVAFLGAYANGLPAQWVATLIDHNHNEALFVPKGSPVQKLEDLRGKKVATSIGSDTPLRAHEGPPAAEYEPEQHRDPWHAAAAARPSDFPAISPSTAPGRSAT